MTTDFFQDAPALGNQYDDDRTLRSYLAWRLPAAMRDEIEPGLRALGAKAGGEYDVRSRSATPPVHVPYDAWGRRVDHIEVSPAWEYFHRAAAEEAIVATGYERRHGALSRVHQFVRLHLFAPACAGYSCPLAMTDGAARALELYGDEELRARALTRLTSRDPDRFWTSGQWMTERTGGSDVGGTSTVARLEGDTYRLYGTKWFTSATTSQMAMTLARIDGSPSGSRGLSLFYLELRDAAGRLQGIQVNRLKEKLGTRPLPTAELTLAGTPARLVGGPGDGVKKIASLFNITRMYNACCSVAGMRRAVALARDYARRRAAFHRTLAEHPLHLETLAALEVETEAAFHLTFRLIELLGRDETGEASEAETAVLRMLTPIAKLYTAKQAVAVASETLECFGGAGYVEDTGLPALLRDAQVLPIWEGTTNVLSLDTLRAIERDHAFEPFLADLRERLGRMQAAELAEARARVALAVRAIEQHLPAAVAEGRDALEAGARRFAFALARTYAASLLLEHAEWALASGGDRRAAVVARRWCAQDLTPFADVDAQHLGESRALALDLDVGGEAARAARRAIA